MLTGAKELIYAVVNGRTGALIAAFMNVGDARFFALKFSELNKRLYVDVVNIENRSKGMFYEGKEFFVKGF